MNICESAPPKLAPLDCRIPTATYDSLVENNDAAILAIWHFGIIDGRCLEGSNRADQEASIGLYNDFYNRLEPLL